ncbi:MAG: hypothetical protein ACK4KV_14845 [Rhodocyclaceae bacterium]
MRRILSCVFVTTALGARIVAEVLAWIAPRSPSPNAIGLEPLATSLGHLGLTEPSIARFDIKESNKLELTFAGAGLGLIGQCLPVRTA